MSFYGNILFSGPIGILHHEKFLKIQPVGLASQVLDRDHVEYIIHQGCAVIQNIVARTTQVSIGQVVSSNAKFTFVHFPLLSPISSIPIPKTVFDPNVYLLCEISKEEIKVLSFHSQLETLVLQYHEHQKLDQNLYQSYIQQFKTKKEIPVRDLTHLPTFHIDPPGCVDIDDFLTLDPSSSKIWIHIVDISKYVDLGSKDDQRGFQYGYTWYFPYHSIHLLEPLKTNEFYVLTMEIDLVNENRVELYPSKIKNHYDFTYSQVQEILDVKKEDHLGFNWSMEVLEKIHPVKYIRQGRKMVWLSDGEIGFQEELLSQRLVAGWMIFYNSWIGKNRNVPQRYHPLTKIYDLDDQNLPDEVKHILWVKQIKQATYEHQHGHFGLDKDYYTHATSPLRRYFDRWIQYLIFYENVRDENVEKKVLEHLNRLELQSEKIRDWVHLQMILKYLDNHSDKKWKAFVVSKHLNGIEFYVYDLQEIVFWRCDSLSPNVVLGAEVQVLLKNKNRKITMIQLL